MERDSLLQIRKKETFPEFIAVSTQSDTISRDMLENKVVFMNFWFENCAPCVAELDNLSELYNQFKDNPSFLFLSFTIDPKESALKCMDKYNIQFPVYPITRDESSRLTVNAGFPTTIILDPKGKTICQHVGGAIKKELIITQFEEYKRIIENQLKIEEL